MKRMQVISSVSDQTKVIELHGVIDEFFSLPEGLIEEGFNHIFDLDRLESINSTGIREWIRFHQKFPNISFHFRRCPKFFIDQVNMVKGFLPQNSVIQSFYVPYFNESSDAEKKVLYESGKEFKGAELRHPDLVLDENNLPMELDVVEARYFKFLGMMK